LYTKDKTTLIQYPAGKTVTSFIIPNSVIYIGSYAFRVCSLTSVTIPNSVAYIGAYAFDDCDNLTSVTFKRADTYLYPGADSGNGYVHSLFPGDLYEKYFAGGKGTYVRESGSYTWEKRE